LRSCCASRRSAFTAPTTISAISEVRIAELIVLAQHKEHESIGEAQKAIRRTSPIASEIAY
jgi:hypothetical protein